MAYPHLKGLEKRPHPATKTIEPKTYHPRLAKRRPVTHNTDPKEEGAREDEQAKEDGLGGGIKLVDVAYEGPRVVDPHMDGPIAHPA